MFLALFPAVLVAATSLAPPIASRHWLNSPPLGPSDLAGKVVVVEFWTFGCINCVRTVPAMRKLHARLDPEQVVLVSVHTPEFDHEKGAKNVERALTRLDVRYPVALDDDFAIWRSFENRYWPAAYVIDRKGRIRHRVIGEIHEGTPRWRELLVTIERLRREPA